MSRELDVLLVSATFLESAALRSRLGQTPVRTVGCRPFTDGELAGLRVGVLTTGLGKANAAMALGAVLEGLTAELVLVSGVGGAYSCSGLAPGDLAVASAEVYGDEGVETSTGFRGLEETDIPLWEAGHERYFNRFPVDPTALRALEAAAGRVGRCAAGPFVTVSTVTGTRSRARDLAQRFGAVCENMEGAAAAHAAVMRDIPFAEVRGISNAVGPRDRASWKLEEAAAVCQRAVLRFLESWRREK